MDSKSLEKTKGLSAQQPGVKAGVKGEVRPEGKGKVSTVTSSRPMSPKSPTGRATTKPAQTVTTVTRTVLVKGVGYRVRKGTPRMGRVKVETKYYKVPQEVLVFDVGMSHSPKYVRPAWVKSTIDSAATTLVREAATGSEDPEIRRWYRASLGMLVDRLCQLRPRNIYTGNGILDADKNYRPLKTTKQGKK
jgi:hypothetical protein